MLSVPSIVLIPSNSPDKLKHRARRHTCRSGICKDFVWPSDLQYKAVSLESLMQYGCISPCKTSRSHFWVYNNICLLYTLCVSNIWLISPCLKKITKNYRGQNYN